MFKLNIYRELNEECKALNLITENEEVDRILALCLMTKISFAFKHDMINHEQLNDLRLKMRLLNEGA